MPDVVKIVFELLDRVLVALAVRIIDLSPPCNPGFYQMPKMIKWNCPFIALGALDPFCAWTNQADIALENIPKLRQLIKPEPPQPPADSGNTRIAFMGVKIFIWRIEARTHRPKFEKRERFSVTAESLLLKKNRTPVSDP